MNLQDAAALTVVATFCGGILLWIASKFFVTRKQFHDMNNKVTGISLQNTSIQNDVEWIKKILANET